MEDLAERVFMEERPIKARRKYNDFMQDLQNAILASAAMPTRRRQLLDIKEYMDGINPNDVSPSTAPQTVSTRPIPVASNGPSDVETRFSKLRHLKADGGMAEVYLARDNNSGSDVIWKQAAPDTKRTLREVNSAIDREAEILRELSHNRIPRYIDSGEVFNQRREKVKVLIMEHLDGQSLNDELRSAIRMGHRHPLNQAIIIVGEVCEALEYMADLDPPVYHRDLKPHNIIMHSERGAVLIDFGLAKGVEAGSGRSLSGGDHTAGWAPPERANGETDSTTDVYGLGQLLYHILTHQPAGISSAETRLSKISEAGHPEWVAYLVNMATVPDSPSKRIQSVLEFRMRLQNENSKD
jgi:serine/threonine protein kinase